MESIESVTLMLDESSLVSLSSLYNMFLLTTHTSALHIYTHQWIVGNPVEMKSQDSGVKFIFSLFVETGEGTGIL
jgi:hypothetical protein